MDQAKIGRFIARRRKELGLTQAELAERLAVTDKAVSKWETGRGLPDPGLFEPLCDTLGVSLAELFAGEKVPPADLMQRTEETAFGLLWLLREWGKQRKLINAAFFALLALDILLTAGRSFLVRKDPDTALALNSWLPSVNVMLLFLTVSFARANRDSRPARWALAAAGAVLLLNGARWVRAIKTK